MTQNDLIIPSDQQLSEQGVPLDAHYFVDSETDLVVPAQSVKDDEMFAQEKLIEQAGLYRKNLTTLDPRYSQGIEVTNHKILVRANLINPVNDDGLFVGFGHVKVPKLGNTSDMMTVPNPYPYELDAVVVASGNSDFVQGEMVQLHPSAIMTQPLPGTSTVINTRAFQRHDAKNDPEKPFDNFGYMLVRAGDIDCKLL